MSLETYGELALGELPSQYDHSVLSPFQSLLDNPNTQFMYLVHLFPYDPNLRGVMLGSPPLGATALGEFDVPFLGGVTAVYLSDVGYTTKPTDTVPNRHFSALVDNPYQFEVSIMSGNDFGSGLPSFGSITIASENGDQDYLTDYYWGSRRILIKAGTIDQSFDTFTDVFDGLVNGIEADDERITLTIRDNKAKLDKELNFSQYAGTGGLNGGVDNTGNVKPLCYGEVKNIEPVAIDTINLVYQVHDGSIVAVDKVRDAGLELVFAGDVADINAAVVPAGHYVTQSSGGYFKLGSTPAGRITADVRGDNKGGYVNTIGGVVQRIVRNRLGLVSLSATEIDGGAFNRLDASIAGAVGVYIPDRISGSSILDDLINPVLGYWTFDRSGILTCGVIDAPAIETSSIDIKVIEESGVQILEEITPCWRIKVGYMPIGVDQGTDELAGAVSDADRAFLGSQYRFVTREDTSVYSQNPQAIERTFYTRLVNKSDAEAVLARLMIIYSVSRRKLKVPLVGGMFRYFVGDTTKITYPRHRLSQGKRMLVTGIAEDAETNQTTLELWG